jgi:hypothetical protein
VAVKHRWEQLSPRTRRLLIVTGVVESMLKVAALVDLRRRSSSDVHGSKKSWAVAIVLLNSGGLVPVGYFLLGRRKGGAG